MLQRVMKYLFKTPSPDKGGICLSLYQLLVVYAVYALGSLFLLLFSSGGWTGIFILLYGWIPFVVVFAVLGTLALAQHKEGNRWVSLHVADIVVVLVLQVFLVLLNQGDCGDAPGAYTFIERVVSMGRDVCSDAKNPTNFLFLLKSISFVFWWLYPILLVTILIRSLVRSTINPEKQLPLLRTGVLLLIFVFTIVVIRVQYMNRIREHDEYLGRSQAMEEIDTMMQEISDKQCQKIDALIADSPQLFSLSFPCWTSLAIKEKEPSLCNNLIDPDLIETCIERLKEKGIGTPPLQQFDDCLGIEAYSDMRWLKVKNGGIIELLTNSTDRVLDACKSPEYFIALVGNDYDIRIKRYEFSSGKLSEGRGNWTNLVADRFGEQNGERIALYLGDCLSGYYTVRTNMIESIDQECNESEQVSTHQVSQYCNADPIPTAIGRDIYPINVERYGDIGFLGELFTADDCSAERRTKIFGVRDNEYVLWPDIRLRHPPSQALLELLVTIGFEPGDTCGGIQDMHECKHWSLLKIVPLQSILQLKPFGDEIKSSGCINCG